MATLTTVSLVNKALVLCGASTITALSDDTPNARALNSIYGPSLQEFLTECRWTFSVTRSTLSTVSTSTMAYLHPEEGYVYNRPTGALRVWEMSDEKAIWREESKYILSDTAGLGALWTWENTEVGIWQPKAAMAFMDKLCYEIAYQIINSVPKAEAFLQKYQQVSLPNAMAENSQTGLSQQVMDDEWTSSKYGRGQNPSRSYS